MWHSQNPFLHTPLVCKMGASSWTSISAILATHVSMTSTSVIGCNITLSASSKILYLPQTHTLFPRLICWRTMRHITCYVPFGNGSTGHISTHSYMGHSSLPQPMVTKTQDCISQANWDILMSHLDMFHNPLPQSNVPSYSIHVDLGVHVSFHDAAISCQLVLTTSHVGGAPGTPPSL